MISEGSPEAYLQNLDSINFIDMTDKSAEF